MSRVTAMVAAAFVTVTTIAGPAGAEPHAGVAGPEARWSQLLEAHPELMAARTEADALSAAAGRRVVDARHDVRWVQEAFLRSEEVLEQAGSERDRASERRDAASRVLATTRRELDVYRGRMDGHAAMIYKHGPPALGPIESLLRSGSPGDYALRHRISEAVLLDDDAALRRADRAHERADEAYRRALAEVDVARAVWESVRDDTEELRDLRSELDGHRASAVRALAVRRGAQASAQAVESGSTAAMSAVEEQIGAADPGRVAALAQRRDAALTAAAEELEEAYPYLGRPSDPRPATLPPLTGYRCPVEDARFVNDWAFPRPGGRSHEGTDVFADRGAVLVSVAAGEVTAVDAQDTHEVGAVSGDLGGRTVTVVTAQGERWYYAHLDTLAEGIQVGVVVDAGQPLGTIGDSGNARGGAPHLHLGRYWQDVAVNPYPSLALAC